MTLDTNKIIDAILATGVPPLAAEAGSNLVDAWIQQCYPIDSLWNVVAVECGFVCPLDSATIIIGVQDLLTQDDAGILGNEWKSTKERTKYWNEDTWLDSISAGSQIAIYALALREGMYHEHGTGRKFEPRVSRSRIRVRAASKSNPPEIWPRKEKDRSRVIEFESSHLDLVKRALLAKAASIRAMKRAQSLPWQLPGIWCTNMFRRTCEFHSDCLSGQYPDGTPEFDISDPAARLALPHIKSDDPDLVILSASSYSSVSECPESYRRKSLATAGDESDLALDTGTALHAGVAQIYTQIRDASVTK